MRKKQKYYVKFKVLGEKQVKHISMTMPCIGMKDVYNKVKLAKKVLKDWAYDFQLCDVNLIFIRNLK